MTDIVALIVALIAVIVLVRAFSHGKWNR